MSFANVRLYSYGVDRVRADVPIFATAAAEAAAGAGTGTTPASFSFKNVKVRRDPGDQAIQVSIDQSDMATLELCDTAVMRFGTTDRWYWITGWREITNSSYPNGSVNRMNVEIGLQYIPVTTSLSLASTMDFIPERMPKATPRVLQNWTQSIMIKSALSTAIPANVGQIPGADGTYASRDFLWCEVTYTDANKMHRIGWFTNAHYGGDVSHAPTPIDDSGHSYRYPGLTATINETLSYVNINNGTVVGIVVSEFCPWSITMVAWANGYVPSVTGGEYWLKKGGDITGGGNVFSVYYNVDFLEVNKLSAMTLNSKTITLTLTDFEKANAQIAIRDSRHNTIMSIPVEKNANSMTIKEDTFSDISGIYTRFECGDQSVIISGSSLPNTSSSWENYRNFVMQYDRQALQNNIDSAYRSMNVTVVNGLTNATIGGAMTGAMKGGIAGAAAGAATGVGAASTSIIGGALQTKYAIKDMYAAQELTESRMEHQPATMNNTADGTHYGHIVHYFGGADIIALMPGDFNSTQWSKQTALWGFPSNKVQQTSVAITTGYWKGRATAFTSMMNNTSAGELNDLLVEQIENGIRLKQVS